MMQDSVHLMKPMRLWASPIYSLLIIAVVYIPVTSLIGMLGIWAERRISARIQSRLGPNRVGYFGLLQSLADGIKVITKEDLIPTGADNWLCRLAPHPASVPGFAAYSARPFGP